MADLARAQPGEASGDSELVREIDLPRTSGTYGDVLAAVGLAELLQDAAQDHQVRIVNRGTAFSIVLSRPRSLSDLEHLPAAPGYPYIRARAGADVPVQIRQTLDYPATAAQIGELRQREAELYAAAQRTRQSVPQEALDELRQQWPMPREKWRPFPALVRLGGHDTANRLHAELASLEPAEFRARVKDALRRLADGQPSGLKWAVSTVQVFSPLAAKGYARLKPDGVGRNDRTKEAWADPFVEWLRYRGYFLVAIPAYHGSRGEHVRILCPIPENVSLAALRGVVGALAPPPAGASPPKIDILATLDLARILVERWEQFASVVTPLPNLRPRTRSPADVIGGLAVTNFQSLGQSRAVSGISELAVPGWFPIESRQDAEAWLTVLAEHREIVRKLQDNHSDEFALLRNYRRFLERRGQPALDALLDFAGAYGAFVLRARETRRFVHQFRAETFGRLVAAMNVSYAAILEDSGFQAVAAAIRRATVSAQTLKANGQPHREIRYGLLPDLRRARELPRNEPFLTAVADFISLYNAENARLREQGRAAPRNVTTDELLGLTRLIDEHGASVVGALLCAYGTCRSSDAPMPGAADQVGGDTLEEPLAGDGPNGIDGADEED